METAQSNETLFVGNPPPERNFLVAESIASGSYYKRIASSGGQCGIVTDYFDCAMQAKANIMHALTKHGIFSRP